MSLNESTVEDAALEWFGELGYSCFGAEALTPALSQGERESYGEVVQSRFARTLTPALSQGEKEKEREAIRRLNPANANGNPHPTSPMGRGEEARATGKRYLQVRMERRQ